MPEQSLPSTPTLEQLVREGGTASRDDVRLAVLKVAYLMEPDMEPDRLRALVQYIAAQGWTAPELAHAAERLPRDERLDQKIRYGGRLTPADFERVIEGAKEVADQIKQPLSREQMERAIELEPQLHRGDFTRQHRPHDDEDRWVLAESKLKSVFGKDRSRPHE